MLPSIFSTEITAAGESMEKKGKIVHCVAGSETHSLHQVFKKGHKIISIRAESQQ